MTQHLDINAWFAEYTGGEPVERAIIFEKLTAAIQSALPNYRFYKSRTQFELPFESGTSYLKLERSKGISYIFFGVNHSEIEETRERLFGPRPTEIRNWPNTINKSSLNMSPLKSGWASPYRAQWPVFGTIGLERACREAIILVSEIVAPFLEQAKDVAGVRKLLTSGGRSDLSSNMETLFAIDHLLCKRDWLDEDLQFCINETPSQKEIVQLQHAHVVDMWAAEKFE